MFVYGSFTITGSYHRCYVETECNNYYTYTLGYYPYSAVGLCVHATPDDSVPKKEGGYECESGYLYIDYSGSSSSCISWEDCIKSGAIVYEEKKTCINGYNCTFYGGYLYQGENGDECVSAKECLDKGWHPYSDLGECLEIDPSSDGNFIERADDIC